MSWAHKNSNLPIQDMLIAVPDDAAYFPFDHHLASTKLIYPEGYDNHTVTNYGLYTGANLCATLRKGEGKYGNAVAIEEPTVNRFSYPSFNTSSSNGGWSHWGSTGHQGTYGQTTDRKYIYGDQQYAHWVANGQEATSTYICYQSPSLGGTPSFRSLSIIACMEDGSEINHDKVRPGWNAGTSQGIPSGTWTSIKQIPGTHFYICRAEGFHQDGTNDLVSCVVVLPGNKVYISFAQLEDKPFATSFVEGERPPSYLSLPPIHPITSDQSFTISMFSKAIDDSRKQGLFEGRWKNSIQVLILLNEASSYNSMTIYYITGDGQNLSWVPNKKIDNLKEWHMHTLTYDGDRLSYYLNGEYIGSKVTTLSPCANSQSGARLGFDLGGYVTNSLFDDLLITSQALSPEEIRAIYHSQRPLYDPNRIDHIVG